MTDALSTGAALLASEQLGLAQWCLDTTVAYVKERKQFGRAIGSFQAIKHRLADLWLQVSSATRGGALRRRHLPPAATPTRPIAARPRAGLLR